MSKQMIDKAQLKQRLLNAKQYWGESPSTDAIVDFVFEQTAELRAEVERLNVGLVAAVDVLALVEDVYCGGRDVPNLEAQVDELKRRLIRMTRQSEEGETIIFDSTDGGGE